MNEPHPSGPYIRPANNHPMQEIRRPRSSTKTTTSIMLTDSDKRRARIIGEVLSRTRYNGRMPSKAMLYALGLIVLEEAVNEGRVKPRHLSLMMESPL